VADNALIRAPGTVDIRGSAFNGTTPPNYTEIEDLAFNSTAASTLINNSTSVNMTLGLNGGRGAAVPLISTTGNFAYGITGTGTGTHTLTLQLGASGAIHVDQNVLTISAPLVEVGGSRSLTKTGAGRLTLSGTNVLTGSTTVSGGILEVANINALGTGATTVDGGTLEINVANA
jgi:autotransporter-associated beta strand protein